MNIINAAKISLEDIENVFVHCEGTTTWGNLYDFACAFKSLCIQKMSEENAVPAPAPVAQPVADAASTPAT
jgi:hypothetical protein